MFPDKLAYPLLVAGFATCAMTVKTSLTLTTHWTPRQQLPSRTWSVIRQRIRVALVPTRYITSPKACDLSEPPPIRV